MLLFINSNKAQNAFEFIVVISIVLFFLLFILIFLSQQTQDIDSAQMLIEAESIADRFLEEVILAKTMRDGYTRTFLIPETLSGFGVEAELREGREFVLIFGEQTFLRFLPYFVAGNVSSGSVEIMKRGGIVGVCSPDCDGEFPLDIFGAFLCLHDEGIWVSCTPQFNIPIDKMRVDCGLGVFDSAVFYLNQTQRGFNREYTGFPVGGSTFEFEDVLFPASGYWEGLVICEDSDSEERIFQDWNIPYGEIVVRNRIVGGCPGGFGAFTCIAGSYFTVTYELECVGGECGDVSAWLDPQ